MSYVAISAALHTVLAAVSGIATVIEYEPKSIQAYPTIYSLLDSFECVDRAGSPVKRTHYRTQHRLCLRWQDPAAAETDVRVYTDAIIAAIDADPRLGGALTNGIAVITGGDTGWQTIGGTECRVVDFYTDVLEK